MEYMLDDVMGLIADELAAYVKVSGINVDIKWLMTARAPPCEDKTYLYIIFTSRAQL